MENIRHANTIKRHNHNLDLIPLDIEKKKNIR